MDAARCGIHQATILYEQLKNNNMNEQFIEKPVGKPVKAYRARVKMYDNDVVVVNPECPRRAIAG